MFVGKKIVKELHALFQFRFQCRKKPAVDPFSQRNRNADLRLVGILGIPEGSFVTQEYSLQTCWDFQKEAFN